MITSALPKEVKEALFEEVPYLEKILLMDGVYLAGGALRCLLTNEPFDADSTDIDLFFRDGGVLEQVKKYLEKYTTYFKIFQCPEGKLASYVNLDGEEPKWKVQCISVDFYPNVESLIDSFDFTCTMFGTRILDDGTWELTTGESSMQDALDKRLVWNVITYPASSLRRLTKYVRKGYWMGEEQYQVFVNRVWEHDSNIQDAKLVYVD